MRRGFKRLGVFLSALIILWTQTAAGLASAATVYELPMDFSGGMPLMQANYRGAGDYRDDSIWVHIQKGVFTHDDGDRTEYWVASIKIMHPSQLRTRSAFGFQLNTDTGTSGMKMAQEVNAVLAINGDFYCYTGYGFIVRQGTQFKNVLRGDRDVLLVDEDGDFHILRTPYSDEVGMTLNGKKVLQAFFFGPALVENGELVRDMDLRYDMRAEEQRARMCIAQVGPLEYRCICTTGNMYGYTGMTLTDFAKLVSKLGVQTAYNLDGGDSTMMAFGGERINSPLDPRDRNIADIIYFASAFGSTYGK